MTGRRCGRLIVLGESLERRPDGNVMWECLCDCGNKVCANGYNLRHGITNSCGCLLSDLNKSRTKYNKYKSCGDYYIGYASNTGAEFYIDADDYDIVKGKTWCENDQGYMYSLTDTDRGIRQHRYILGLTDEDVLIDHINRNRKDNRKANLRIATKQQNAVNRLAGRNSTTGVKGVGLTPNKQKYHVSISKDGHTYYLGTFDSIEEAKAYHDEVEVRLFGEFAVNKGGDL